MHYRTDIADKALKAEAGRAAGRAAEAAREVPPTPKRQRREGKSVGRDSLPLAEFVAFHESHRRGVHAVTQAGRRRAVREDVAEVGVAAAAQHFGADVVHAPIRDGRDVFVVGRFQEARPAGAGIELRSRIEERLPTADADVGRIVVVVPERAGAGALGAALAGHAVLLRRQNLPPFCISLDRLSDHPLVSPPVRVSRDL